MKTPSRPVLDSILTMIAGALVLFGCDDPAKDSPTGERFDVGIYTGAGAFGESVKASFAVVRNSGFTCDSIDLDDLGDNSIELYSAILFPGGDTRLYSDLVGPVGRGVIRSFIADGGGYIGFGAGGAFAVADSGSWPGIGLINGSTRYPSDRIIPNPYYGITEITQARSSGPVTRADRYQTLYYGGPEFFPSNEAELSVDYHYTITGTTAALSGSYGLGRFWVAGFQPEIEEGNSRDATTFGDDLADLDSEWDLIEAALDYTVGIGVSEVDQR